MRASMLTMLAMLLVALASGCDLRGSGEDSTSLGLLTRSEEPGQGEMTGIVRGTLALDTARGCILLSGKPVVWPAETTLTLDPPVLHLPGGLTATPGDTIAGTGGEVPGARLQETLLQIEGDVSAALACAPADSEVVVFTARGAGLSVSPG